VQVLRNFDALVLTEVYPAGEAKIPGADGKSLMKAALVEDKNARTPLHSAAVVFASSVAEMPEKLNQVLKDGDVLITMGAGSIGAVAAQVLELKKNESGAAK
jgi:UDP-N-acetylmuramate--alanine ligase